ncbi:hypothetical protein BBO_09516 [Beauveria brongniartii RCEF 3172]|uniref:Uncharacterized protein n=1 Tax=Beauveria brongniartii RCEF 3172 TaxID=1081107 RepID=A0A166PSH1_9HYPO|nr:hypothetical protein BBO_09516 [Beauveria brongniartii RCEF 3172]
MLASGIIDTKNDGPGGTITVTNNTVLAFSQYTLESVSTSALYWWGSKTSDLPKGLRINNERVSADNTTDSNTKGSLF